MDSLRVGWNWPVVRERLTILVIVGRSMDEHSLKSQVGMGSESDWNLVIFLSCLAYAVINSIDLSVYNIHTPCQNGWTCQWLFYHMTAHHSSSATMNSCQNKNRSWPSAVTLLRRWQDFTSSKNTNLSYPYLCIYCIHWGDVQNFGMFGLRGHPQYGSLNTCRRNREKWQYEVTSCTK